MIPTTNIPVSITPEATRHVADLGLEKEFERVLEHTLQTIPGVRSLRVSLEPAYDLDIPCVLLEAPVSDYPPAQEARKAWGLWRLTELTPEVGQHFMLLLYPEPSHAG
jgi:hypothetical protein